MQAPKVTAEAELLLKEIDDVFPFMEMPTSVELTFHHDDCYLCAEVRRFLDGSRNVKVDDELIRFLHQELYHLSPMAFRWVLPHYLKYCLSSGGRYSQEETYFLVYHLSPDPEFQDDTHRRLSLLNVAQKNCLVNFLRWCEGNEDWVEIAEDIDRAFKFLQSV
jgi:Family of unknown function (DUF6714)